MNLNRIQNDKYEYRLTLFDYTEIMGNVEIRILIQDKFGTKFTWKRKNRSL